LAHDSDGGVTKWLNADWIGVLTVEQNGFIEIHREPIDQPTPDRSRQLEEMITSAHETFLAPA
jgi:hypothetical protein